MALPPIVKESRISYKMVVVQGDPVEMAEQLKKLPDGVYLDQDLCVIKDEYLELIFVQDEVEEETL